MTTHAMLNRTTKATPTKITGAPLLKWLAAFCVLNSVSATESRPEPVPSELQVLVRQEVAHLRGEIEAQVQELLRRGEFEAQVLRQELLELRACTGCMPPSSSPASESPLPPPSPPPPSPSPPPPSCPGLYETHICKEKDDCRLCGELENCMARKACRLVALGVGVGVGVAVVTHPLFG